MHTDGTYKEQAQDGKYRKTAHGCPGEKTVRRSIRKAGGDGALPYAACEEKIPYFFHPRRA